MDLLKPHTTFSFGRFEAIILGLYAALTGCVIYYHEPWTDEAQAWLIARDSSLGELFLKRLHYEGTPGLWHFLLWILCRLHLPYASMHWASALVGIAAVYVLLRYAPLPLLVRAAIPFTFPLIFQTAVLARSYSLVPLLAFLICAVLPGKRNRPVTLAFLLGLLANTSLFAFVLAVGMVPVCLARLNKENARPSKRSLLLSGTVLGLLFLFAVYTALPATDISFGPGRTFALHRHISYVLSRLTASPWPAPNQPAAALPMKTASDPLKDFLARHFASRHLIGGLFVRALGIASIAFYSVSQFNLLAILFYALLLLWQWRHRALLASLPLLLILIAGQYLGMGDHHTSLVATAIIVALWLSWSPLVTARGFDLVFQIVLLAVLVEQVAWTAHAAIFDIRGPFDGSASAAQFILPKADQYRIAGIGVDDSAILPYAGHNIFYNQSSTYWPWKVGYNPDDSIVQTVDQHPDFIFDTETYVGDTSVVDQIITVVPRGQIFDLRDKAAYFLQHGYHQTHRFCGFQPAHFGFARETCLVVYQPSK